MRRSLACLILPLGLLGAACQAPDEAIVNFTQYRAAFTQAVGEYFKRCGVLDPAREPKLASMSLLAAPPELQRIIDEEVMIGRARLTTECFAPLKEASCDLNDAFATISACLTGGKQYIPQVSAGQLCRLQGECIDGFCDLGLIKKPCGMGACSPYLKAGTQCGTGKGQCNPDKETCWQGVCRARGGAGTDCVSDADCNLDSFCRTDMAGALRCAARQKGLATGSACDGAQVPDGCKAEDRCTESMPGKGDFSCRTSRSEGGACSSAADCRGGLICAGADMGQGQCKRQGRIGESCRESGAVCQLTLYCGADGTCKPAGGSGEACELVIGGQACLSGLCSAMAMQSGRCQEPKVDGSACTAAFECRSGACDRSGLCGSVCAPLR